MKHQALFSLKDRNKKYLSVIKIFKCHLLQFLFWALRVNHLYAVDNNGS